MKPLALDLCCGLGGWTEALLQEGWDVIGFDIERHEYGDQKYPGQLVIQDIRTINGADWKGKVSLIVASPPCVHYSWMAMPWSRGKQVARAIRGHDKFPENYKGPRTIEQLNELFNHCVRIGKECGCPTIIENVRGAQPWVGRAQAWFGSFYLWGDVPALMPIPSRAIKLPGNNSDSRWENREVQRLKDALRHPQYKSEGHKTAGMNWSDQTIRGQDFTRIAGQQAGGVKVPSDNGLRTDIGNGARITSRDCGVESGVKQGGDWFNASQPSISRRTGSKSPARKAASAMIAKIPYSLASWIARCFKPKEVVT